MNNILVTGSKGFIGKNLITRLKLDSKNNILEFTRDNSMKDLEELVLQSDFIYHTAGEVRSTSSDDEFKSSNVTLIKNIVDLLQKYSKKTPILLVSSIHAELQKNEYGKTKRESELLVQKYANDSKATCFIYRLPHVFGEGCKPNYNSVVSTWIYNSINNFEINVFDNSIEMHYVYVQDVVSEFVEKLQSETSELYITPKKIYDTTLGELVKYLTEFNHNINKKEYKIKENEFKEKLFRTYKDYLLKNGRR